MAMPEARTGRFVDILSAMKMMREEGIDAYTLLEMGLEFDKRDRIRFLEPLARLNQKDSLNPSNFGIGKAGKNALKYLTSRSECEAPVSEPCRERPVLTLDYDAAYDLEQRTLCFEHLESLMVPISKALKIRGDLSFGINGWGRA
jgi:hypothetical protein